jgi:hypothetical protein
MSTYIVRLDKMQATKAGNIVSVQADANITHNGCVCALGALNTDERELFDVAAIDADVSDVILIAAPEVVYDNLGKSGLKNFSITTGDEVRGYHLYRGDIFTLTSDCITVDSGTMAVGYHVYAVDGAYVLHAASADPGSSNFVGKVIEVTTLGYDATVAYAILVIKSE